MEIKPYYTNFTFEQELEAQKKIQYNAINKLFEYLFLWIEDDSKILYSIHNYSSSYLEKIKELTGTIPGIASQAKEFNLWWGDSYALREAEINSKVTSFNARIDLGLTLPNSYVIRDRDELNDKNGDFIYKSEFGFSGRGQVRSLEMLKKISLPIVVEPYLKVIENFGISFINREEYFVMQNFNDILGQFKGGVLRENYPLMIYEKGKIIFDWYFKKYGIDNLQIDMFSYEENGELKWNYLCEVNHRKTMGWVLWKLHKLFNQTYSAIKVFKNKPAASQNDIVLIELSPSDHILPMFYIGSESEEALSRYLQNLS
jgi:hypothetical protein